MSNYLEALRKLEAGDETAAQTHALLAVADAIGQHSTDAAEQTMKLLMRLDKLGAQIRSTR